jgi:hypothetical protein
MHPARVSHAVGSASMGCGERSCGVHRTATWVAHICGDVGVGGAPGSSIARGVSERKHLACEGCTALPRQVAGKVDLGDAPAASVPRRTFERKHLAAAYKARGVAIAATLASISACAPLMISV